MRKALAPYRNQFILAEGWIDNWEDLHDCRKVLIKQPTIRKPNKEILFNKQEIISTEHHLNLFIPFNHLLNFDTTFETHNKISFSGYINYYTRSDGSKDYAINTDEQSTICFELEKVCAAIMDILNSNSITSFDGSYFTDYALPKLKELDERLDGYGNNLPTFKYTYNWYKETIVICMDVIDKTMNSIKTIKSNRAYRRAFKKIKSSIKGFIFM